MSAETFAGITFFVGTLVFAFVMLHAIYRARHDDKHGKNKG